MDEIASRRCALGRTLSGAGFVVLEAMSGRDGLDQASELAPDIVVVEMPLRDISGYEACRLLKGDAKTAAIPLLLICDEFEEPEDLAQEPEGGADGYLEHPTELVLIATIRALLRASRAEQALRRPAGETAAVLELRSQLAAIIESSDDAILSKGLDGVIRTWNAAAERMFGYRAEEIVGKSILLLLPPERIEEEERILDRLKKGQRIEHLETVRLAKDGRRVDVSVSVSPLRDSQGRLTGASKIIRDNSDRKRAEEGLRHSEERLRLAQEAARIGSFEWDLRTNCLQWTPQMEMLYGLSPGSFDSRYESWRKLVHPDDLAETERNLQEASRNREDEREFRIIWPDGSVHWVVGRSHVFRDKSGRPLRMVGVNIDITERKRAEQLLLAQSHILELVAAGRPRAECLTALTEAVACLHPQCSAAVVLANEAREAIESTISGQIPASFGQGIAGARISNMATGSCPKAMFDGVRVTCPEIATDQRWCSDWRDLCAVHGIRSAHSTPIFRQDGVAVAAFFLARGSVGPPTEWELRLADFGARIGSIVLERDRVFSALRAGEERLRLAAEGVDMGIWDLDLRTNVTTRTLRHDQIFGYEELQPLWTLDIALRHVLPEDRPAIDEAYAVAERTGTLFHESRVRWPDGSIHWISARGRMHYDIQGRPVRIAGVVTDVTERKQAEEALRHREALLNAIVDCLPVGLLIFDADHNLVRWNRALADIWGELPASLKPEDWVGYRPETGQRLKPHEWPCARAFDGGQPVAALLEVERFDNRQHRIELVNAAPVRDPGGKIIGAVAAQVDITDRKRAEEELRRLKDELEGRVEQRTAELAAANKELEAFGYTVSHDLRAPLRHVAGFVEMLTDHAAASLDDEGREYLKIISDSAARMGQLIDDLLTLSRLGRAAMTQTDVDLRRLVDETIAELAPATAGRSIDWQIGPLPQVRGDRTLLRNAMVNLVSNAVKYSRNRNPARIEIGSEQRNGEVVCYVRDNGAGFDMRFVDKLYGVFQRLHVAEEFEGTGIGLASVRRIVQRHGGRVWAEGAVDEGATFYFALPRSKTNGWTD